MDGTLSQGNLAFAGAEGFGSGADGGRGGQIVKVTSLAESGPGTLRWALEELEGPRIVVFEVSGRIDLTEPIYVNGDVTIAGQTSPEGITITGAKLRIVESDVIVRGLHFRPGDGEGDAGDERDGISIGSPLQTVENVIVDGNSFSWSVDELVTVWYGARNITLSNNIFAEALKNSIHPKGDHSMGVLIGDGSSNITVVGNLFAHNEFRNATVKDSSTQIEFINNLIYNYGNQGFHGHAESTAHIIGNLYLAGADTGTIPAIRLVVPGDGTAYYLDDNVADVGGDALSTISDSLVFAPSNVSVLPSSEVMDYVLANAGARFPSLGAVDARIVQSVIDGTGTIIDSPDDVGGYENVANPPPPSDRDNDGVPDSHEEDVGTDPDVFDANDDVDGNGISNIEDYINGLIQRADTNGPFVQSSSAANIGPTQAGTTTTDVTVTFADNEAIDTASIDPGDIAVTGPGGALSVTGVSLDTASDGTPRTATYTVAAPGGSWDSADDGVYTVALLAGEVADTSGNTVAANANLTAFNVDTVDTTIPVVQNISAPDVGAADLGNASTEIAMVFADNIAIDTASIDVGDITVTGPGGALSVTGVSLDTASDGTPRTATYTIAAPGGSWDSADDGAYTVALLGGEVADTSGNTVAADPALASFTVESGDSTVPVVQSASAPDIGPAQDGTATTDITVTFADDVAIDTASIDAGDITVTGPGGALSVTGVSLDTNSDGTPRTATYTVAAPGGSWDSADDGSYTVALLGGEVADTSGNPVAADPALDGFTVDLSSPPPPPPDPIRVETESFEILNGFSVKSNGHASNGQFLQASGSGEQRAAHTFALTAGVYDLTIGHFDESDGQSQMRILVNGTQIDSFVWDLDAGGKFSDQSSFAERTISGVSLNAGDVIEIVGFEDAGEPLRTDYMDFQYVGSGGPDTTAPVVQSASAPDIGPAQVGTTTTDITVTFADNVAIDTASIDVGDITVTGPGGALSVTGVSLDAASDGTPRTATYTVAAPGGTWDSADDGSYTVALLGGEVADTSTNIVAADPALVSFTVDSADTTAPVVQSSSAPDIGPAQDGTTTTDITVTFADDVAIDTASIDVGDVTVTGPGGALSVTGVSLDAASDGTPRTATYAVAAPGGSWDSADDGAYTVALLGGEVADTSGNPVAADPALNGFTVNLSSPPPPPPDPFRVEAESFEILSGFSVKSNGHASNGQFLQAGGNGEQRAAYTFAQSDGIYDLTIGYFDESDGQSQMSILVNGTQIDSFVWNLDAGGKFADKSSFAERTISGVSLSAGDVIEIVGFKDKGEPLRTDYVDFEFVDTLFA